MEKLHLAFAQRLREAMIRAGKEMGLDRPLHVQYLSYMGGGLQGDFGRSLNNNRPMTLHGVRRWLQGGTLPTQNKLLTLAEWLGVEPQTLRFGDEVAQAVRKRRKAWDEGIGYQEREIFELFLKLPVPQRNVAREVIVALARANTLLPLAGAR